MLTRAMWHGKARYITGVAGTSYRVSPDCRLYTITGTAAPADPPELLLPYCGDKAATPLSKVLRVDLGFEITVVCEGTGSDRVLVKNQNGATVATVAGGETAKITYVVPLSFQGAWSARIGTLL